MTIYEEVMEKDPDFETAFNLMLCYYTKGEKEKMKHNFCEMLGIEVLADEDDQEAEDDKGKDLKNDALRQELKERKSRAARFLTDAAKLIAPVIEDSEVAGYDWIIEIMKGSKSSYTGV
jgi:intraflagellar transport protein 88